MNILILGTDSVEQKLIELCLKSKFLGKIYTASKKALDGIPNIEFDSYEELVQKAKALQIDLTLMTNENYISEGIVEVFRKNLLNIISVNKKWFNLETSRLIAKQLSNYYSINIPNLIKVPITFPVVIRTNSQKETKIAYSMDDLVQKKEILGSERTFLEEYLDGEVFSMLSIWDGKNLAHFNPQYDFTEVQLDRLELLKTKLHFMFSDEKADFIGFFTTKIIWAKNDWHVLDYVMRITKDSVTALEGIDFLFLLNSAIYQKLNEI